MGKIFKLGVVLFIITAVTGLILGGVYTLTLEPIRAAKEREKIEALAQTLPGATEFAGVAIEGDHGLIKEVNRGTADGELVGYNYTVAPKGYGGLLEIIAGISKEGKLMAIKILNHSETPGLGAKAAEEPFLSQFHGKPVSHLRVTKTGATADNDIQAISGATITSSAVVTGVNAALTYFNKHQSNSPVALGDEDGGTGASPLKDETVARPTLSSGKLTQREVGE